MGGYTQLYEMSITGNNVYGVQEKDLNWTPPHRLLFAAAVGGFAYAVVGENESQPGSVTVK